MYVCECVPSIPSFMGTKCLFSIVGMRRGKKLPFHYNSVVALISFIKYEVPTRTGIQRQRHFCRFNLKTNKEATLLEEEKSCPGVQ